MSDSYFNITEETINAAVKPPAYPPLMSGSYGYKNDTSLKVNNLRGKQFKYAYRWIYDDKEKSIFSPHSTVLIPQLEETVGGFFVEDITVNNRIDIGLYTGSELVEKIEVVVKVGELGTWQSYDILDKEELFISNDDIITYEFLNDKVPNAIDQSLVEQSSNFSPKKAVVQEYLPTNELSYGEVTEGDDKVVLNVEVAKKITTIPYDNVFTAFDNDKLTRTRSTLIFTYGHIRLPETADVNKKYVLNAELPDGRVVRIDAPDGLVGITDYPKQLRNYFIERLREEGIGTKDEGGRSAFWDDDGSGDLIWYFTSRRVILNPGDVIRERFESPDDFTLVYPLNLNLTAEGVVDTKLNGLYGNLVDLNTVIAEKNKSYGIGQYKLGLLYKDDYGRQSFVQTNNKMDLIVESSDYSNSIINKVDFEWSIKHLPPVGSKYYQWAVTANLSEVKSTQWTIDDVEEYSNQGNNFVKIGAQRSILGNKDINNKFNVEPYTFNDGDFIRRLGLWDSNTLGLKPSNDAFNYEIIGVEYRETKTEKQYDLDSEGNFKGVDVPVKDAEGDAIPVDGSLVILVRYNKTESVLGSELFKANTLIDIVTPKKELSEDVYYAIGNVYPVEETDAGRFHIGGTQSQSPFNPQGVPAKGVLSEGDKVLRARADLYKGNDYQCLAKNASDYFDSGMNGYGKVSVENEDSEQKDYRLIRHSGKYFDNTNVNDLSFFRAENYITLDDGNGNISNIKQVGDTLRVIQKNKRTSVYIGKSNVRLADGQDQLVAVDKTFGTVYPSEDSYGTDISTSVCKHNRNLYWFDKDRGELVRSAPNGEVEVDSMGMSAYFSQKKKELIDAENNGQANNVVTWFDIENGELVVTFTVHESTDTVVFKEENGWMAFYDWYVENGGVKTAPEKYGNIGDLFFSFLNGEVYIHDATDNFNEFYGTVRDFSVSAVMNEAAAEDKHYKGLSMDSTKALDVEITTPITSTRQVGHKTIMKKEGMRSRQGVFTTTVNRNIRIASGGDDLNLILSGDRVAGKFAVLKLSRTPDSDISLYEIGVSYLLQI